MTKMKMPLNEVARENHKMSGVNHLNTISSGRTFVQGKANKILDFANKILDFDFMSK